MCRNPVVFLGFSGFTWVLVFQFYPFCVYVRVGAKGEKCKIPLILPFLGSYLSFRL